MRTHVTACQVDIALVIDCSGSIRDTNPRGVDNWQLILNFVENLVSSINVGEQETHVGAVSFGTKYKICYDLLQLTTLFIDSIKVS